MNELQISTSIDIGGLLDLQGIINKQVFPLLNQAVRGVAQQTASNWQENVYQAKLWSGEKKAYAKSITWAMTGDFTALVQSDYQYDRDIESGRPARDLKKMLDTSSKVRRTKDGRRFLIIPMRHSVKKLEDAGLYGMAQSLEASKVTGQGKRQSGEVTHISPNSGMSKAAHQTPYLSNTKTKQAMMVNQNQYAWGGHLSRAGMKAAGIDAATRKWAAGMHRFDTSTPGGGKSSSYLSFRVMMENSQGWIVPAQPGQYIAKKTALNMQILAQTVFAEAVKRTLS
jgi:hypothetical protein